MKKRIFLTFMFAVTFALLPSTTHAQPCKDITGLINRNITITLKSDCAIDNPVTIAGNVTIKSSGKNTHTIKRGIDGNLIRLKEGASLTLENVIIDGGKQDGFTNANAANSSASLVFVDNGATLIMNKGAVLQNNVSHNGGGVLVGNGSTFTMNGGVITGNISDIGGGVFMRHGGIFYMKDGAIVNNTANDFGGGVFVNDAGRFTMSGGEISNNTANVVGGGVNVWGGVFTMTAGAICGNRASDGDGVFVYDGAEFNNESGAICGSVDNSIISAADQDPSENTTAPVNLLPGKFTAGPNPVSRTAGEVIFFHQGNQIRSGSKLKIFDASGKLINNIRITDKDKAIIGNDARRAVGSWNLKDFRGRTVSVGTYVVEGNFTTADGKKEKVSLVLGVR